MHVMTAVHVESLVRVGKAAKSDRPKTRPPSKYLMITTPPTPTYAHHVFIHATNLLAAL